MAKRGSFLDYIKAAFLWRWNLLAVGTATAFAFLSGQPDVVLPLLAAGELAYLGLLSSNPRFRKAIDVRVQAPPAATNQQELVQHIRSVLKPEAWARFEYLQKRCLRLNQLSRQYRGPRASKEDVASDMQTSSLERLLWMFLKLIYSEDALRRFLGGTDRNGLLKKIEDGEKDLQRAIEKGRGDKLVKSIEDKLETLKQRLANYDRAVENLDFLTAEIDRVEQKVNAISEMAMNSRDASEITAHVDGIAAGISATEDAIRALDVGPVFEREEAPPLLREAPRRTVSEKH